MSRLRVGTFLGRPPPEHSERVLPKAISVKRQTNIYVEQQTEKLQDVLHNLERAKLDQDRAESDMERRFHQKNVKALQERYDMTMIVLLAVQKINTELIVARNNLDNVASQKCDVNLVRKRIRFLEERIRSLVQETDVDVHLNRQSSNSSSDSHSVDDRPGIRLSDYHDESRLPSKTSVSFVDARNIGTQAQFPSDELSVRSNCLRELTNWAPELLMAKDPVARSSNENIESISGETVDSSMKSTDVKEMTLEIGRNTTSFLVSSNSSPRSVFLTESRRRQGSSPNRTGASPPRTPADSWRQGNESSTNYWNAEHHRLSYSSLRNVDSLFYHQMSLSVQDSYVDDVQPSGELPVVPGRRSSDVSDVQTKALNDLSKQVGKLYFRVREASKLSINLGVDQMNRGNSIDLNEGSISRSSIAPQSTQDGSIVTLSSPRCRKLAPLRISALPLAKTTKGMEFPRSSVCFSSSKPGQDSPALRIVDQRDLLADIDAMQSLFKSKRSVRVKSESVESRFRKILASDAKREESSVAGKCRMQEQADERVRNEPLKWNRIQDLINLTKTALDRVDDRIDAVRQLGALKCTDSRVLEALGHVLEKDTDERVIYEAAKSLVSLGCWSEEVQKQLIHYLLDGSREMKCDLMLAMINGRRVAENYKTYPTFVDLCRMVSLLSRDTDVDNELSFHAAVCSCHTFGVIDNQVTAKLEAVLNASKNLHYRAKALKLLVNEARTFEVKLIKNILDQLQHSAVWTHRRDAASHLIHFGSMPRPTNAVINQVYKVLIVCLSGDVNQHVRLEVGKALASFDLIGRACQDIDRQLMDDGSEKARACAVIAIGTLGLKTERILKSLLDMAELDVSHRVRYLVIRTLGQLGSRDHRILELLRTCSSNPDERIATEAKKSLTALNVLTT